MPEHARTRRGRWLSDVISLLRELGVDVRGEVRRGVVNRLLYSHTGLYTLMVKLKPHMKLPLWLKLQLDPGSPGYEQSLDGLPLLNRAYREWAALGLPDEELEAVISPDGIVATPITSAWLWAVIGGDVVAPSDAESLSYYMPDARRPRFQVCWSTRGLSVVEDVEAVRVEGRYVVHVRLHAEGGRGFKLLVVSSPFTPYGIRPQHVVQVEDGVILVNGFVGISALTPPDEAYAIGAEEYTLEDVALGLIRPGRRAESRVGLAYAALAYELKEGMLDLDLLMPMEPLSPERGGVLTSISVDHLNTARTSCSALWEKLHSKCMRVKVSPRLEELYTASVTYLYVLYDNGRITPGPTVYHNFWIRDSAYMLAALLQVGLVEEARRILVEMLKVQREDGLFTPITSLRGPLEVVEYDSNGQVLWSAGTFLEYYWDERLAEKAYPKLARAAKLVEELVEAEPDRLLPKSLSAEDLGPEDKYYWDDFWAIAGLLKLANVASALGLRDDAHHYALLASEIEEALWRSVVDTMSRYRTGFLPAGPRRRLDSAVGRALALYHPLRLLEPGTELGRELIRNAMRFMWRGGFLHSVLWGALGSYITMHLAHALVLERDRKGLVKPLRWLMEVTGPFKAWAEAYNPKTMKGGVGDIPHGWAAADFVMLVRDMLVCEHRGELWLTPAVPLSLLDGHELGVRRGLTVFGSISFTARLDGDKWVYELQGDADPPGGIVVFPPSGVVKDVVGVGGIEVVGEGRECVVVRLRGYAGKLILRMEK